MGGKKQTANKSKVSASSATGGNAAKKPLGQVAARKTPRKKPAKTSRARKAGLTASRCPVAPKYKGRSGSVASRKALWIIRKLQDSTGLMNPKLPFQRVVREIIQGDLGKSDFRIQGEALAALQEAAEARLVEEFTIAHRGTIHGKRITLQEKDMEMASDIRRMITGDASTEARTAEGGGEVHEEGLLQRI